MAIQEPGIPKGTRDFGPVEMSKRNHIFNTIKKVFHNHGFSQIETPAMENLDTLLGKYGEEGDKLIFKILESGEYFDDIKNKLIKSQESILINEYLLRFYKYLIFIYAKNNISNITVIEEVFENEIPNIQYKELPLKEDIALIIKQYLKKNELKISNDIENLFGNYFSSNELNDRNLDFFFRKYVKPRVLGVSTYLIDTYIPNSYFNSLNSKKVTDSISKKGLRYDLTVPFARFVVQHQHEIEFPFKRYQVQPVWRADRPQKGRYREFYQCDADVIGSNSLLNEADLIRIIDEVFRDLNVRVKIKLNNRKILTGIAEYIGQPDKIVDITVAIDKLEKIGIEAVSQELQNKGITVQSLYKLEPVFAIRGTNKEKITSLTNLLKTSQTGMKGIEEVEKLFGILEPLNIRSEVEFDISLARGLNYYTGTIIEVKALDVEIGSICGGGRYDDLTGIFGLKDISGVGVSFGADRIYDVMEQLKLFPAETVQSSKVLFANFGEKEVMYCLGLLPKLHEMGVSAEIYPDAAKLKKQFSYADSRHIQYVVLAGENEIAEGILAVKNMTTGEQFKATVEELVKMLG